MGCRDGISFEHDIYPGLLPLTTPILMYHPCLQKGTIGASEFFSASVANVCVIRNTI